MLNAEQTKLVNRIARNWTKPTVCTQWVFDGIDDSDLTILDYGAGKFLSQTKLLREAGFANVTPYDIGDNNVEGNTIHGTTFHVVMASNVINVLPENDIAFRVLDELVTYTSGMLVVNVPSTPRKNEVNLNMVTGFIARKNFRIIHLDTNKNLAVFERPLFHG